MGAKRPYTSEGGFGDAQPSSKHVYSRPGQSTRPNLSKPRSSHSSAAALNPIKAKIRDVTRLLERSDNLPAGVRIEKERALAGYRQDLEQAEAEKRKQQMISKYHMVRFFERQKATRNLKKLRARIANADCSTAEYRDLQHAVHEAEVDVNYALYHPLDEKYQGIFPRTGDNSAMIEDRADDQRAREPVITKPAVWRVVEKCMRDGTLESLRDGTLRRNLRNDRSRQQHQTKARHTESGKSKDEMLKGPAATKTASTERDGDSDGGFFEE